MDCEPEISWFIPLFYPSSQDTPPDPASTAARLVDDADGNPVISAALATDLPHFLLYSASAHPTHTDHILQTIKLLLDDTSLPLVEWTSRPDATFAEMFNVAFRDDVNDAIRGPIKVSERASYIAASIVCGRARSLNMLHTPLIEGSLADGLKFPPPHVIVDDYQGEEAEIVVIGCCLQLLGGASYLLEHQPWRFTKDKILAALDCVQSGKNDILIQFTKAHIQKELVVDLTSEEIVDSLKTEGWQVPVD